MPDLRTIPSVEYKDFSLRLHDRFGQRDRVIKAQLELTYRCNLHCIHCYTDPYNNRQDIRKELSLDEIRRILDELAGLEIVFLNLTGGEIFTHSHFFEIYDYAYRKGFLLMLYTNGTIMTTAIIERLQQTPPFSIDISCHSVNEEAFDRFTQVPGSFKSFMKSMDLLRHSGLPFCFKTKAMNWNRDELPQIRAFVESFGQPFGFTTSLSPRLNGDLSSLEYRLAPAEIAALEGLQREAEENEPCQETDEWPAPATDRLYRCGCGTNSIHINARGELGTCTLQYERRASLRDYSVKDAIDKVFGEIRALRYSTDSPCRTCQVHTFCDKKPTEARWEQGNAEEPIPYDCDVAVSRARQVLQQPLLHPLSTLQSIRRSAT